MSLPLREPFFLKGRTSVVQRAVIMSVVLGVLTGAAGWMVGLTAWAMLQLDRVTYLAQIICISWALAVTGLIYAPLNYWNRRPLLWTLAALPLTYATVQAVQLIIDNGDLDLAVIRASASFVGAALVVGLLQLRLRRLHFVAYGVSVLFAAVPVLTAFLLQQSDHQLIQSFAGEMAPAILLAGMVCGWLASLAIPWGIPFWWPPEKNAGDA